MSNGQCYKTKESVIDFISEGKSCYKLRMIHLEWVLKRGDHKLWEVTKSEVLQGENLVSFKFF